MHNTRHGRTLRLDPAALSAALSRRGVSVEQLADELDVSTGSVNNWLSGKPAYRTTAARLADVLETNLSALLESGLQARTANSIHEYLLSEVTTDWLQTSNGLRFQICRLRHAELDRFARGKRFDLRDLPTDMAQRCQSRIKRHPTVCEALQNHPNVIRNITAFHDPVDRFYWVVDEWINGDLLANQLCKSQIRHETARDLLMDIAQGLKALHRHGIIRRELNPNNILVRETDHSCVLTEFELAKLSENAPTVSTKDWPRDPYRAGETNSNDVDARADIYSWARIATHLLLGELPESGTEAQRLVEIKLPGRFNAVVSRGVSCFRDDRPDSIDDVISAMNDWM